MLVLLIVQWGHSHFAVNMHICRHAVTLLTKYSQIMLIYNREMILLIAIIYITASKIVSLTFILITNHAHWSMQIYISKIEFYMVVLL